VRKFPYLEDNIKVGKKKLKQLTIEVGEPEITFAAGFCMTIRSQGF
jgi:hypothetical protein